MQRSEPKTAISGKIVFT